MVDRVMCESKRKGKERETETGKRDLGPPGRLGAVRCGDGARLTQAHLPSCVCSLWSKQEKKKKKNPESLGKALLGAQRERTKQHLQSERGCTESVHELLSGYMSAFVSVQ